MPKKQVYKRNVYIGTINNKPTYKTVRAHTKKELDEKVAELRMQKKAGKRINEKAVFSVWANKWLTEKEMHKGVTESAITQHKINIKVLNSVFGEMELKDIKCSDFQRFINDVQKASPLSNKPLSKSSIKKLITTARKIFEYAIANDVVATNFFDSIDVPACAHETKRRALTEFEQQMIIDTPHRCQLPAMIMLFSGLRRGELCGLMWSDIDLNNATISVTRSVDLRTGKLKDGGKTINAVRVVPIPPILVDYLRDYKASQKTLGLYVCTNTKGALFRDKYFSEMWDSYLKDLNVKYGYNGTRSKCEPNGLPMRIERFTPHYLRHTYATLLYLQGVDKVDAMQYMGHADIQTTINIYTDLKTFNKATLSDAYKLKLQGEYKIMSA